MTHDDQAEEPTFVASPRRWRIGIGAAVALVVLVLGGTVGVGVVQAALDGGSRTIAPREAAAPSGAAGGVRQSSPDPTGAAYVHVAGAVKRPGLYVLRAGSRVADAIVAAGGFAPGAERAGVNLARSVKDGEQLLVPVVGASPPPVARSPSEPAGSGESSLDLNAATADQLETLPRIGPALAARIIAWRDENGPFGAVDELLLVPGIGEKLLAGFRERVHV